MKKMLITSALVLGATLGLTTATFAQSGQMDRPTSSQGMRSHKSNSAPAVSDTERGGPGPRVQGGSGTGSGAER